MVSVLVASLAVIVGAQPAGAAFADITTYGVYPGELGPSPSFARANSGDLWFTSPLTDGIGWIRSSGVITHVHPSGLIDAPQEIALGPDNAMWFTSPGNDSIGRIDVNTLAVTTYTDPAIDMPFGITSGTDNAMWFTSQGNNRIGRIEVGGSNTISTYTGPGIDEPTGIAASYTGHLWFTNRGNDTLGRIASTPDHTIDSYGNPDLVTPTAITQGPDGHIWFTSQGNDRIGQITVDTQVITTFSDPAGNVDLPSGLVGAIGGRLWFTSQGNDRIGFIDMATGAITTYADAEGEVDAPIAIAIGGDARPWFTSSGNERFGRFEQYGISVALSAPPSVLFGQPITYQATVENTGLVAFGGFNVMFPNSQTTGCDVVVDLLLPGTPQTFTCDYMPSAPGPVSNHATLLFGGLLPNLTSDEVTTDVLGSPSMSLGLVAPASVPLGQGIEYDLSIENTGNVPLTGVAVSDLLPGADCDLSVADVAVGAVAQHSCTVTPQAAGQVANTLTVSTQELAPQDSDEVTTDVVGDPPPICATTPFSDVPGSSIFLQDICWMAQEGITTGYADGTFKPARAVTRQAMSAFMYRLAGEPEFVPPGAPSFSDVGEGHAFFEEIEWMAAEGITHGTNGLYRPDQAVSRQAMAAFMYRVAGEPEFVPPGAPSFSDVAESHAFFEEIEWMEAAGITQGFPGGIFKPAEAVTRQSMSAFMHRLDSGPGVQL